MQPIKIAIILCTFNGEKFIFDQLQSLLNQTYQNFTIYISDDGSSDKTLEIIQQFKRYIDIGIIQISTGPRQGYGKNFISNLVKHIDEADYFCYCDQDDIWDLRKLEYILNILSNYKNEPALYFSVTNLISEYGKIIGNSKFKNIKPSFKNAICQNLAGGNTMMFNKRAASLFRYLSNDIEISSHDWVTYLLVASVDGKIYYDNFSYISYRQHSGNCVGDNQGIKSKIIRLCAFYNGIYRAWNNQNIHLLSNFPHITDLNKKHLSNFKNLHCGGFILRTITLFKFPFRRVSIFETILFYLGAFFKLL